MQNPDFDDDGGTPMWRARHRVIDVTPVRGGVYRPRKRLTFVQAAMLIAFVGYALPFIVIFGGIIVLAIFDAVTG